MTVLTRRLPRAPRHLAPVWATATVPLLCLLLIGPVTSSVAAGAVAPSGMSPSIVVRAGSSNVLYVLWESTTCMRQRCLRLERSNNAGQSFFDVTVPSVTPVRYEKQSPISQLYFANPSDGYALEYGSTGAKWTTTALFATFDGGRVWRRDRFAPNAQILSMASSESYFYATVDQCPSTTSKCSESRLIRSPVSVSKWTRLALPKRLAKYWLGNLSIAASGRNVWLTTQDQTSSPYSPFLATSHNDGRTFNVAVQADLTSVNSCSLMASSPDVLWATCDQGMMQGDVPYSDNGGASWQESGQGLLGRFGFGVFDAVSAHLAYFINVFRQPTLFRVDSETSPARTQVRMPNRGDWISLDFTNAQQGVALSQGNGGGLHNRLWSTDDGGAAWSQVKL
ncbi:MAG: hypothetical protein WA614_00290 [Acidimicrobiales bacterium]